MLLPLLLALAGALEIHQIDTGRGNAALVIFPDGQTLLVDAGAVPSRPGPQLAPARPNESRTPGEWIARYIARASRRQPATLDYAVVTHYHDDHMGAIQEVARHVPISRLLDRGNDPPPPADTLSEAYRRWRGSLGGRAVTVHPGHADQIRIAGCEVRTVAANGTVWTGGTESTARSVFPARWQDLPAAERPNENHFSIALRVRCGAFEYYTGGDLVGTVLDNLPAWHDLETPVAQAVGEVDVAVLNHHGWLDSTNAFFLATLRPRVLIVPAWHATHPDHGVVRRAISPRIYAGPRDLFTTALLDAPRDVLSYLPRSPFTAAGGHIVVRVAPGGDTYRVQLVDSRDEAGRVVSEHGPFESR